MKKLRITIGLVVIIFGFSIVNGYFFGLKSFDNSIYNIKQIEENFNFNIPIIGFIFDPRSDDILHTINTLNQELGTGKIYHITLSPNSYNTQQVHEGKFDKEYRQFFQAIKDNDLQIIFRTMHEMNGGRYPRGSNPEIFKKARIHVRNLSREIGLDQKNILFDMSVNHRDMPTTQTPSQNAELIKCTPKNKYKILEKKIFIKTGYRDEIVEQKKTVFTNGIIQYKTFTTTKNIAYPIYRIQTGEIQKCFTFEDYFPGDKYVDIMGVTFYNRGKATYSRQRYNPDEILNDSEWDTLKRLESLQKPIFIDEVGTTAVRYTGTYSQEKSIEVYDTQYYQKNEWLNSLKDFMLKNPKILGFLYFNVDYTNGLKNWTPGEADRAIINLNNNKVYFGIHDLYNNSQNDAIGQLFKTNGNTNQTTQHPVQISQQQKQELANLMIIKFGKNESIERINDILSITDNKYLKQLLKDLKKIISG